MSKKLPKDPPVRGPFGYATITLKPNATPTQAKPICLHGERAEGYKKVTNDWIEKGFIEKVKGHVEWVSPGFVVPKKANDWRGVVDMRGPNSQTQRVSYPLPKIEDILVDFGDAEMLSVMDLLKAFHQQPMHPDSRPITSTHTPFGIYQWRVNIMGLTNAGQQFQAMLEWVLRDCREFCRPYIDDILIATKAKPGEDVVEKHNFHIREVLKALKQEVLIADPDKCRFFLKEVEFCGHILGGGRRRPAPGRLLALQKWERPTTITALRSFLGFTNYYAICLEGYAHIVAKLQDKLKVSKKEGKKGSKLGITWDEEDEKLFTTIKEKLCGKLELVHVDPDRPFVLRCDASTYAIGAALEQMRDKETPPTAENILSGGTAPIAFMSRKLAPNQRRWTPREQETYGY